MDPGVRHVGLPVDLGLGLQEGLVLRLHVAQHLAVGGEVVGWREGGGGEVVVRW